MRDIQEQLGRRDFSRLRFGIGRSERGEGTTGHVLERFTPGEEARLSDQVPAAAAAVEAIVLEGVVAAMNRVNAPPGATEAPE
jgi:PTH1 family peptidyl-tRNA hydrolase